MQRTRDTCGPDVDGFSVAGVFEDFEGDVGKGAGEGGELLVRRVEEFCTVKDEQSTPKPTMKMLP